MGNYFIPRSIVSGMFGLSLLFPSISSAQTSYRLVNDDSDIICGCVYVIAASDRDIVASKMGADNRIYSIDAQRSDDGATISVSDADKGNMLEILANYYDYSNVSAEMFTGYNWALCDDGRGSMLLSLNTGGVLVKGPAKAVKDPSKDDKNYTFLTKIGINPTSHEASIVFSNYSGHANKPLGFVDGDEGGYELLPLSADAINAHGLQLYRKDIYDLRVVEPKDVYRSGDKIKIHVNVFDASDPNSKGYLFYIFADDDSPLYPDDIFDLSRSFQQSDYEATGEVALTYPGGDKVLWVCREHAGSGSFNDILCVRLRESKGVTSDGAGIFTEPKSKGYAIGEAVDFKKGDDVKIYYTLDGRDPVIANAEKAIAAADFPTVGGSRSADDDSDVPEEGDEPSGPTGNPDSEHAGRTYDLDVRPIIFDGSALDIRYVAVRDGYEPSEVKTLQLRDTSTGLDIPMVDQNSAPVYHDLMGRSVKSPDVPGVYLLTVDGKTRKIVIR